MGSGEQHSPEFPSLLRTKLHRPQVTENLVARPRLVEYLDSRRRRPLTLVSAPAGYGKTTLVSSWLEEADWPSAWLSLDQYDDDLAGFLTYFVAAVRTMFPEAGAETLALLKAASLPPLPVLARGLANDLDGIESRFILALDDYHVIRELAIHELLSELLQHPPRPMHLVITTRIAPALPLSQLRARSQMTEIRADDLYFTPAETAALLGLMLERPVEEATAAALAEKTEGWITGLRLAVLALRPQGDLDDLLASLPEHSHYVIEYLMSEVLSHLPEAIQDFLLKTSILDRFCGPLCDHVVDLDEPECNGRAYVEWLDEANLFTIPLDSRREWYRYHHQFQQLLRQRLEGRYREAEVAALHARASTWYAQSGLIEEALRHALAAGDTETAVFLVSQHRHNLINEENWHHLDRWLHLFPPILVEKEIELLLTEAWSLYNRAKYYEVLAVLDQAESLLAQIDRTTAVARQHQAEINAIRSELVLILEVDGEQVVALAQQALPEIPHDWFSVRGLLNFMLAYGYQMIGDLENGFQIIYDALRRDRSGNSTYRGRLLITLGFLNLANADLLNLEITGRQLLELGEEADLIESIAFARYFLGYFHYQRNALVEAKKHLVLATSNRNIAQITTIVRSANALALTYQASGNPDQALEAARSTIAFLSEMQSVDFLPRVHSLQAELALQQGHLDQAVRWARQYDPYPLPLMAAYFLPPQLTMAKVLLAENTIASRKQATELLTRLHDHVLNDKRYLIEVLALQALLDDVQGEQTAALEKLEQSIHLAEPGGFIRLFVDLGPRMAALLIQQADRGMAQAYIAQILNAFTPKRLLTTTVNQDGLLEPLTDRELEILYLLEEKLSNKEIAAQLVISPATVKRHNINIYQKLAVNSRKQAVEKATTLGLLVPRQ